ncbi:unnamed protein product [Spirodela intermedia]|uniref:J domain-containing protein n=1 Tax=Spirodela intermedia TaxID=51605 RepID=A0A7I8JRJ3_SPIIN|nr:unnamed protein product [Spirodela intermedia]CAA6672391.1 unnamed protein product [Spirodela intermedia]
MRKKPNDRNPSFEHPLRRRRRPSARRRQKHRHPSAAADPGLRRCLPAGAVAPAMSRSLYEVLRIKETASAAEIKGAYRALAKRFHPDAVSSAEAAAGDLSICRSGSGDDFIEIHRAYETLSDAAARVEYDRSIMRFRFTGGSWPRTRRWETDQCW